MQHQKIRIEEHAARGHQLKRGIIEKCSVLDGRAAGHDSRPRAVRSMRMNDGAQPHLGSLAASGVDLIHAHGHLAAVANAGGGEELDQVRALRLQLVYLSANLFGCAGFVGDLRQGREQARAGDRVASDHVPQIAIERRAHALHRGEPAHERRVQIRFGIQRGLLGSRFRAGAFFLQAA